MYVAYYPGFRARESIEEYPALTCSRRRGGARVMAASPFRSARVPDLHGRPARLVRMLPGVPTKRLAATTKIVTVDKNCRRPASEEMSTNGSSSTSSKSAAFPSTVPHSSCSPIKSAASAVPARSASYGLSPAEIKLCSSS